MGRRRLWRWGKGIIKAIDYQTGKVRWSHEIGDGAGGGVLTTDSRNYLHRRCHGMGWPSIPAREKLSGMRRGRRYRRFTYHLRT